MMWRVFVGCVLATASLWIPHSNATNFGDPPKIDRGHESLVVGQVGDNIKLQCHVDDLIAFVTWYKDGEELNDMWVRHKRLAAFLRIKSAVEEDTGIYTCKAVNGYGEDKISYTLHVLNNSSEIPDDLSVPTHNPNHSPHKAPEFERPENMRAMQQAPVGHTVRLKCRASGSPEPQVSWSKDGRSIQAPLYQSSRERQGDKWTLVLSDLDLQDAGSYTCDVINIEGRITFTYSLAVIGRIDQNDRPVINDLQPVNTTVHYGDIASFQCKVQSQFPPTVQNLCPRVHIEEGNLTVRYHNPVILHCTVTAYSHFIIHIMWLKRVDSRKDLINSNNTIIFEEQEYIVLQSFASVMSKQDGVYMNKLYIPSATTQDAGKYICMGSNDVGFSVKHAYLTVLPKRTSGADGFSSQALSEKRTLLVLIAIPACLVVVLISIAIYCLCSKRRSDHSAAPKSSANLHHHGAPVTSGLLSPNGKSSAMGNSPKRGGNLSNGGGVMGNGLNSSSGGGSSTYDHPYKAVPPSSSNGPYAPAPTPIGYVPGGATPVPLYNSHYGAQYEGHPPSAHYSGGYGQMPDNGMLSNQDSAYSGLLNEYAANMNNSAATNGPVYLKNYGGLHTPSEASSSGVGGASGHRSSTPPTNQNVASHYPYSAPPPHAHAHYQNYVT